MLAAIRELAESRPDEKKEHMAVLDYLEACSLIFENGILSAQPVNCPSLSPILRNIEKGFQFFSGEVITKVYFTIYNVHGLIF